MPARSRLAYEILRDRPVAYFPCQDTATPLNEVKPALTLDAVNSPLYNRATVEQGPNVTLLSSSAYFNGSSSSTYSPQAGASGLISLFCLVRPTSLSDTTMLISKGGGGVYEYDMQCNANGSLYFGIYTSAGLNIATVTSAAGLLKVGRVSACGVSCDVAGTLLRLYWNGAEVARTTTFSGSTSATAANFQVGHRFDNAGATYVGAIGHVAVFGSALSAGRHVALARSAFTGPEDSRARR